MAETNAEQNIEQDAEIVLTHGPWRLAVSPWGASLRGLSLWSGEGYEDVITSYVGAKQKVGGQGDVLIPFPGRVAAGRYDFNGQSHQMKKNDSEGPNAIHGFLRQTAWEIVSQNPDWVMFRTQFTANAHEGYPFALTARVTYHLDDNGLACAFDIINNGDTPAPVSAGFHPYFTAGTTLIDPDTLTLPFESYLEYANMLPTGNVLPVAGSPYDFRTSGTVGSTVFNTCFLAPTRDDDGLTRIRLSAPASDGNTGRTVAVWLDETFGYVVLYSGDPLPENHRRRALAIEPMTCGSDAFNHHAWGLAVLAPGAALEGTWGVSVE